MAKLTSKILGPFLIGPLLILLIVFKSAASFSDAIRWVLILLVLTVLPGLVGFIWLMRQRRLDNLIQFREQRTRLYLLASTSAAIGLGILLSLHAPAAIIATFVTGLAVLVTFTLINLWWKISVHTAYVTASAVVTIILYGAIGLLALALAPLIAWARLKLNHHTVAQVSAGAVLAGAFTVAIFHLFGLV